MNDSAMIDLLKRMQRRGVVVAVVGGVLALIGLFFDRSQFFQSYLMAYLFLLGLSLGSLALLFVYYLTGGRWGFMLRRVFEAVAVGSGLLLLLALPLFFGLSDLYSWAQPARVAADPLLQHKEPYLNIPFFVVRNGIYFIVWVGATFLLLRWSGQQDRTAQDAYVLAERMRYFSGPALALYGLTITFAAMDWLMSLEPHWFSTIFGAMIGATQVVAGLAFSTIVLIRLAPHDGELDGVVDEHLDDLGKMTLAFALFWAYMSFMQYLIIWAGNLPEEVVWYLRRLRHGWQWVALLVLLCHFVLPFAALLSGRIRKRRRSLTMVAASIVGSDLLFYWWLVAPVFHPTLHLHWLDVVLPIALGALWIALLSWQLRRRPLLALHDPVRATLAGRTTVLKEVLAHE